uniref:Cystatin domain-containing protein n=1 Tax=Syphacia muris TaxID=451379 RepID=A0A0N5A9U7_9BILA
MYRAVLLQLIAVIALTIADENLEGGFRDVPIDDEIRGMVDRAMVKVNQMRNGIFYVAPVNILSAKEQVVAGTRTVITFEFQETSCTTRDMAPTEVTARNCPVNNNGMKEKITVAVWSKPWESFEEISIVPRTIE